MSIAENVARIRAEMEAAAIACGRDPKEIKLCAATKMNDAEAVRQAIAAGVDCCGENRVQELTQKLSENAYEGVPVHFIGHLQKNKVKNVVGLACLIHSVDSLSLMDEIEKQAAKLSLVQDVLLEINIGREAAKGGFSGVGNMEASYSSIRCCRIFSAFFLLPFTAIPVGIHFVLRLPPTE